MKLLTNIDTNPTAKLNPLRRNVENFLALKRPEKVFNVPVAAMKYYYYF